MASLEDKVNCVLRFAELEFVTAVQKKFRTHYNKEASHTNSIFKRLEKFQETGSVNGKPMIWQAKHQ